MTFYYSRVWLQISDGIMGRNICQVRAALVVECSGSGSKHIRVHVIKNGYNFFYNSLTLLTEDRARNQKVD